jgi:hypothetical protein
MGFMQPNISPSTPNAYLVNVLFQDGREICQRVDMPCDQPPAYRHTTWHSATSPPPAEFAPHCVLLYAPQRREILQFHAESLLDMIEVRNGSDASAVALLDECGRELEGFETLCNISTDSLALDFFCAFKIVVGMVFRQV